jgi:hypothetical protein
MLCPNCGAVTPPGAAECPNCGALFGVGSSWNPDTSKSQQEGPSIFRAMSRTLGVLLLLFALLVTLVVAYFYVPCFVKACAGMSGIPLTFALFTVVGSLLAGLPLYVLGREA